MMNIFTRTKLIAVRGGAAVSFGAFPRLIAAI
jgi:hypothetical protein